MSEQESLKISQQNLEEVEQVLELNKVKLDGFGEVLRSGQPRGFCLEGKSLTFLSIFEQLRKKNSLVLMFEEPSILSMYKHGYVFRILWISLFCW